MSSFAFGVAGVAASAASTASDTSTGRLVRGGCTSPAANANNNLGMAAGLQDSSGAGRKSVPTVQAFAEVDTARPIAVPVVADERELGEVEEEVGMPPPPTPLPPNAGGGGQDAPPPINSLPSIQDGEREVEGVGTGCYYRMVFALHGVACPCCPACALFSFVLVVCGMKVSWGYAMIQVYHSVYC